MKKYKLLDREANGFCRIQALKDFNDVNSGDIGGYVESEDNLSHNGDCWIYDDARVYGYARVSGDARVSDNALVFGYALVSGDALVFGYALVSGDALVFGDAQVYGNARVYGSARVYGNACVTVECSKTPISITEKPYNITITDNHLRAGCKVFTFEEWKNFSDKEILEMDGKTALKFYKGVLVPALLPMCLDHQAD